MISTQGMDDQQIHAITRIRYLAHECFREQIGNPMVEVVDPQTEVVGRSRGKERVRRKTVGKRKRKDGSELSIEATEDDHSQLCISLIETDHSPLYDNQEDHSPLCLGEDSEMCYDPDKVDETQVCDAGNEVDESHFGGPGEDVDVVVDVDGDSHFHRVTEDVDIGVDDSQFPPATEEVDEKPPHVGDDGSQPLSNATVEVVSLENGENVSQQNNASVLV